MSKTDRVAELEQEVAGLKTENAGLTAELADANEARSRYYAICCKAGVVPVMPPADYPTPSERDSLLRFALARWPKLADNVPFERIGDAFRAAFDRAFLSLCFAVARTEKLDRGQYMTYWQRTCQDWLARQGYQPAELQYGPFICAVLCHGFGHSAPYGHRQNLSMSAAMARGGGAYRPQEWKRVLELGRVREPDDIKLPVPAVTGPNIETVVVGDRNFMNPANRWW